MRSKVTYKPLSQKILLAVYLFAITTIGIHAEEIAEQSSDERLVVAFHQARINWNPLHSSSSTEAQVYTAIYEGLVSYHPLTLEPVPGVAHDWEISEDRKVYTFQLRENARYCTAEPVLAEHFRNAWLKLLDPAENTEYSFLLDIIENARDYRNGNMENPEEVGIRALSPHVLEVRLETPADHFIKILPHHSLAPVHPDLVNKRDWSDLEIIPSNGPFRMTNKDPGLLRFVRNDQYWDASKVEASALDILLSDNAEDLTRRFNNKEIHWTSNFIYNQLESPERTFIINPQFATSYFFFNTTEEPWISSEVRRALNKLVDWQAVRNQDLLYLPTSRVVPSISAYPEVQSIEEQDIETAMQLLEKAGYPEGKGLPDPVIKILPVAEHRIFALAMKQAWDELLGLDTKVVETEFATFYEDLDTRDYTLSLMSWIGDYPDPLTFLQMWVSDSNLNKGLYSNPEYDRMIAEAMSARGSERYRLLSEAERLILHESAIIPYKHAPALNAVHLDSLQYWMFNPLDIHPFKYMRYFLPPLIPNTVRGADPRLMASACK